MPLNIHTCLNVFLYYYFYAKKAETPECTGVIAKDQEEADIRTT